MSPFRPIAPAPLSPPPPPLPPPHHIVQMDNVYAATCNPPRRAKRLRADSFTHDSASPAPSVPDDDPYDVPQPPQPKRRGRKPGTLSRAAREAQRKINHSLIEKARRTKINDALATLRQLVPADSKRSGSGSGSDDHRPPQDESDDEQDQPGASTRSRQHKAKGSGEKEFKLEILVRTVAYLQDLTEKAKLLERDGCPHCNHPIFLLGDENRTGSHGATADVAPAVSAAAPTSRLPSISTWLPTLTPSQSPSCDLSIASPSRTPANGGNLNQLPTPPTSATFTPSANIAGVPPALTLPSPSTFLPVRGYPSAFIRGPGSATANGTGAGAGIPAHGRVTSGNGKASPVASPVYTPEDETAASLLLRMSTCASTASPPTLATSPQAADKRPCPFSGSSPTSGWFPASACAGGNEDLEAGRGSDARSALTPSRLLGLTKVSFNKGRGRQGDLRQP